MISDDLQVKYPNASRFLAEHPEFITVDEAISYLEKVTDS